MEAPNHSQGACLSPIILQCSSIGDFVQSIIDRHAAPTTLIICSTRDSFRESLFNDLQRFGKDSSTDIEVRARFWYEDGSFQPRLLTPTIRLLSNTQTISIIYCPTLEALYGYLSNYTPFAISLCSDIETSLSPPRVPLLAVLSPIALHSGTSSFSAQGLMRTFAAAVDAAARAHQKLVITEHALQHDPDVQVPSLDVMREDPPAGSGEYGPGTLHSNPWLREVSIMSTATKSFGPGKMGWTGRTVKVSRVAQRWFRFVTCREWEHELNLCV